MNTLQQALQALSNVCDNAQEKDGSGFNKFDSSFGKYWALKLKLDMYEAHAAWKMLRKYTKQLSGLGVDYNAIPEPIINAVVRDITEIPVNTYRMVSKYPGKCRKCGKSISVGEEILYARPYVWCIECGGVQNQKPRNYIDFIAGTLLDVHFQYDVELVAEIKKIEGSKFNRDTNSWVFQLLSVNNIDMLIDFLIVNNFSISEEVYAAIENTKQVIEQQIINSKAGTADIVIDGLGGILLPFQVAGVQYASEAKRCFIADEMGLGKTCQALATIQYLNSYPAIVVCPARLKYNWENEVKNWLPGKTVQVLNSKDVDIVSDIIIINYDILKKWLMRLQKIHAQAIILDESHLLKNYKTQRTKAVKELVKNIPVRLCLTGTPVLNRPQELISQLGVLGRLNDLGGFRYITTRFCDAKQTRWGLDLSGASNLVELNTKLRAICFVRRLKKEVLPELPEKRRTIVPVDIDNMEEYKKAEADVAQFLANNAIEEQQFLSSLIGLTEDEKKQKIQDRMAEVSAVVKKAEELVKIEALKKLVAHGKMNAIVEWIENFLETGEKLAVFAHHRDIVQHIVDTFNAVRVNGGAGVTKFQQDENCKIIVCSLQADSVGITLTESSNVLFIEFGWTPSIQDQAEDRCHRIGQKDAVNAWYLVGKDTIDESIISLIDAKRKVIDAVTDGKEVDADSRISVLKEVTDILISKI